MHLSIAVGALTFYPLDVTLAIARDAGVQDAEVLLTPRMLARGGAAIASRGRRAGVAMTSAHAVLALRRETLDEKTAMDIASIRTAAGIEECRSIVLHTPLTANGEPSAVEHWLDAVVETRERARPSLDLALENRAENWDGTPDQWLDDLGRLAAIAGEWGARVCLDLAHAASVDLDLAAAVAAVRPQLVNVHVSDARPRRFRGGLLNGLFRDHALPGQGVLALDDALAALAASRYTGPLTIELNPVSLRAWLPGAPRRRLRGVVIDLHRRIEALPAATEEPAPRSHRAL